MKFRKEIQNFFFKKITKKIVENIKCKLRILETRASDIFTVLQPKR